MRRVLFIINPISGGKNKANVPQLIEDNLDRNTFSYSIVYTEHAGHAIELAKNSNQEHFEICVAVGGDGTINEVAQGLLNSDVNLGIIPMGSGNGLARHLNIPLNTTLAIQKLNSGKEQTIDTGRFNSKLFLCTSGIGFDAEIAHKFSESKQRGFKSYALLTYQALKHFQPPTFTLDNKGQKTSAYLISFANASQWGNNFFISPNSSVSDAKLEACIIKPFPWWYTPFLILKIVNKTINTSKYFETFSFDHLRVQANAKTWGHVDGEPNLKEQSFEVTINPASLTVIA